MPKISRSEKSQSKDNQSKETIQEETIQEEAFQEEAIQEETIQEILRRVEEEVRRKLRLGDLTLDEIEEQSQNIGEEVKKIIEEKSLELVGTGYTSHSLSCPFGSGRKSHHARYVGLRSRQLITLSGVRWLKRGYYHCNECGKGWCPTDQGLEIGRGQCSRRVQALIARFSSYLPYRTVAQEMETICGIRLATSTIARYAQALGQRIGQEWEQLANVREAEDLPASDIPAKQRPSRLHTTMDGVMVHVDGDWHEAKLGCVYQTKEKVKESTKDQTKGEDKDQGGVTHARYMATLSASASFGKRLRVLAHRSGTDRCRDVAVVADGAEWIWQETGKYFPQSVQVVDFYHTCQHLWAFAQARFGDGKSAGAEWMRIQTEQLLADKISEVITEVSDWSFDKVSDQEIQRLLVGYLSKHQKRMCYKTFRDKGYHIGSGVAESGCKNVVQQRMKGSGMRWGREGAEAQLQLCAHWKSDGANDFRAYTTSFATC